MLHAILAQDWMRTNRRGWLNALRVSYAGWLIVQFFFLVFSPNTDARRALADGSFVNQYLDVFVVQHFLLILLATPPFAAGSLADEKAKGTLPILLTTELSSADIIVGKWLAGAAQAAWAALPGVPLFVFAAGLGGIDLMAVAGFGAYTLVLLMALAAVSVAAAVHSGQIRDAVFRVYALGLGVLIVLWLARVYVVGPQLIASKDPWLAALGKNCDHVLRCLDPLYALEPAWTFGGVPEFLSRLQVAAVVWGVVAASSVAWSIVRLRPVAALELEHGKAPTQRRHKEIRRVFDDSILWKAWAVGGIASSPGLRWIPCLLGCYLIVQLVAIQFVAAFVTKSDDLWWYDLFVPLLAFLMIGPRAAAALSGEREKQTWESLLLTPLETRELIRPMLHGILLAAAPYLATYAIASLLLAVFLPPHYVVCKVLVAAVTVASAYLLGAYGLWNSSRCTSSWRSGLITSVGFAGIFSVSLILFGVTSVVPAWVINGIVFTLVPILTGATAPHALFLLIFLPMFVVQFSWHCWRTADKYLYRAERHVADTERIGDALATRILRSLSKVAAVPRKSNVQQPVPTMSPKEE